MASNEHTGPWLFIGAGNMATAIAAGAIRAGTMAPDSVAAFDPNADSNTAISACFSDVASAAAWLGDQGDAGGVVLATKPQMFPKVAESWRPVLDGLGSRLVVSILAGTPCESLAAGLGPNARVVRVMPNTPISLGLGMAGVATGPRADADDLERVERLFASVGKAIRIDEGLMDAFTGVAGSGPAYVFYLADAMLEAAMQLGFDREHAITMVRQTVVGAGELLARSPESPRALRAAVTSKGGTTAAATVLLDDAGVHDAVVRAVHAARHRGAELANG